MFAVPDTSVSVLELGITSRLVDAIQSTRRTISPLVGEDIVSIRGPSPLQPVLFEAVINLLFPCKYLFSLYLLEWIDVGLRGSGLSGLG